MDTLAFTVSSNTIKYFGINKRKEMKDFYSENFKYLKKEIERNTRKWKAILYSKISRSNIVKMTILPKVTYGFNLIPGKYS